MASAAGALDEGLDRGGHHLAPLGAWDGCAHRVTIEAIGNTLERPAGW